MEFKATMWNIKLQKSDECKEDNVNSISTEYRET